MMSADTRWAKSSYSFANGNCVEVARLPGVVAVRDSEDPGGPVLACVDRRGRLPARLEPGIPALAWPRSTPTPDGSARKLAPGAGSRTRPLIPALAHWPREHPGLLRTCLRLSRRFPYAFTHHWQQKPR